MCLLERNRGEREREREREREAGKVEIKRGGEGVELYTVYPTLSDLVEQVDLGDHISSVPRVAYQHDNQLDKGVHGVVALSPGHCCIDGLWEGKNR